MPASFGGGNVDIRLKSIPDQFVFDVSGQLGYNTNNFDDGIEYNGGSNDWYGVDDGTREIPDSIMDIYNSGQSLDDLTPEQSRALALDLNRDYDPQATSVNPNTKFTATLGNSFESGDWRYGFLSAVSYDNKYFVGEEYQGEDFRLGENSAAMVCGYDKIIATEHNVKMSGMVNFGIEYNAHRIDLSTLILRDTEDKIRDRLGIDENNNQSDNKRIRSYDVRYEERELIVNQIKGMHTFDFLNYAGFDWKYSNGRSNRYAPGNMQTRFIVNDANEDGNYDLVNEIALTNATTAARYTFQDLNDEVENYGFNFTFPIMLDGLDIELKSGADYVSKSARLRIVALT